MQRRRFKPIVARQKLYSNNMNLSCEEHYATGLAFLELGTPESAIESFQEALRASPKDTEILVR